MEQEPDPLIYIVLDIIINQIEKRKKGDDIIIYKTE